MRRTRCGPSPSPPSAVPDAISIASTLRADEKDVCLKAVEHAQVVRLDGKLRVGLAAAGAAVWLVLTRPDVPVTGAAR